MKWWILGGLPLAGLVLRIATFGDPALHTDEEFYFFVGQRILDGYVPYIDIWDRKPPGLFAIYAAIAAVSRNVLAYQIAAWLSASFTAFTISRIVSGWTGWRGQFLSGLVYLACLNAMYGFGGQAPVFYNLLMASAALMIVRSLPALQEGIVPPRVFGAIGLCGLALTVKQTTIVESLFFGAFVLMTAAGAGLAKTLTHLALFGLIGAAPFALFSLAYTFAGYGPQFYQAMVLSNFARPHLPNALWHALSMVIANALPLVLGLAGAWVMKPSLERRFVVGWLLSALIGVALVPNFVWHYALPTFVPLAVMTAAILDRPLIGPLWASLLVASCVLLSDAFDFKLHRDSRASMEAMAASADAHNRKGTMLVYDGPVYLYAMTGTKFLSPLVMPWHLSEIMEAQASGIVARDEVRRILSMGPGVIVLADKPTSVTQDIEGRRIVERYVAQNCRTVDEQIAHEARRRDVIRIWGDCR